VAVNFQIAKSLGVITPLGNRPLSEIAKTGPWTAAWNQYAAHKNSFS